jgi:PAS domain S-box-containing protein
MNTFLKLKKIDSRLHLNSNILDQIQNGIITTDIRGIILSWNKGAEKILGYNYNEIIGKNISILHPENDSSIVSNIYSLVTKKDFIESEIIYRSKSREKIYCQVTITLLRNKQGLVLGVIKYIKDITTNYITKQLLDDTEQKFRLLAENIESIFFIIKKEGEKFKLIYINDAFEKIWGLSIVEVYKNPEYLLSLVHPEDYQLVYNEYDSIFNRGKTNSIFNYRIINTRGEIRWLSTNCSVLNFKNGLVKEVGGIVTDNTERENANYILAESEEKFRSLAECVNAIFFICDIVEGKSKLIYVSPAYEKIRGIPVSEVLKDPFICLNSVHPDDLLRVKESFNNNLKTNGINPEITYRIIKPSGEIKWLSTRITIVYDKNGIPKRSIGITSDITELKITEDKLSQINERLHSLTQHMQNIREEERKRISREIHDELGQLLTALKIDLTRLSQNPSQKIEESIYEIKTMLSLVDSSIKSVKEIATELRPGILDQLGLTAAIDWQIKEFQARTKIKCKSNLNVEFDNLDTSKSTAIFRIFQEVLTNISRHSNANHVHVELNLKNNDLILIVKDNGKGITKDEISNHKSLGLIGIRERVYLLNGSFKISGVPGNGTKVIISAPVNIQTLVE